MKTFLINRWDRLRSSFWFVPSLLSIGALGLAVLGPTLDAILGSWIATNLPWIGVSASAARATLSTIGSAMVSVAGIVFSIMIVALSITSSQYGSRLLRTFMSDAMTQCSLGIMLATSLYCLLALATVHDRGQAATADVSVILGVLLAILSVAVLIYFIHHVATLMQAPNVVAAVAAELDDAIERLFPELIGEGDGGDFTPQELESHLNRLGNGFTTVHSDREGYLQAIDEDGLVELALKKDIVVALNLKPGQFVSQGQTVARVWHATDSEEELRDFLRDRFILGRRRTPRQDAGCPIEELVEIAVRALSPGINDPFTAVTCVDRLGASLSRMAKRKMPSSIRYDQEGELRVLARPTTFADALNVAFHQIRQYGSGTVAVSIRLLEALTRIAASATRTRDRQAICRHVDALRRCFEEKVTEPIDVVAFEQHFDRLIHVLDSPKLIE